MSQKTKEKIKAALIRAGRTFAQTAVGVVGTTMLITEVRWDVVLSASALAAVMSLLTSWATGLPEVNDQDSGGKHYGEG